MAPDIDAVVFDIGGVLMDWNPRHLYRKLFDDEVEMEHFLATICTLDWHVAHDLGDDIPASCAALALEHPEHAALINAWAERGEEMIRDAIHETVELVAELKAAGTRCYVLSNMERETFPLRLERFEFMRWFDGHVISGQEGVVKPDPAIFQRLLERFDLTAERTVFIDDNAINVEAAAAMGIQAILFESPERLRESLQELGLLGR